MADREVSDGWQRLVQAEGAGTSEDAAAEDGAAANRPPQAQDVCVATAEDTAVDVPVLARVSDPDGDSLQLLAAAGPTSGEVSLNPDGTVTYTPAAPGLQSFRYQVGDGQGGVADGNVSVLVNPADGELDRPVLAGLDDQQLARLARACAAGSALETVTLAGPEVVVQAPEPGTRVQVRTEPGQSIELAGGEFAGASYIVVEGGLLVVTEDGRMVYLSGFVDSAESGPPPTLAVAGGEPVPANELMKDLQPFGAPAEESMVARLVAPAAGPTHGGGAGFSPYDAGNLGPGLDPIGPLAATELGPRPEFLLRGVGEFGGGAGNDDGGGGPLGPPEPPEPPEEPANGRPQLTVSGEITAEVGEVTRPIEFVSAPPFPALSERGAIDLDLVNGVDPRNLVLGPNADATITFRDEGARFQNNLGVALVDPDGALGDGRVVFAQVERLEADPSLPDVRPGGGPRFAGEEVRLSDLYTPGELGEGQQVAFFTLVDGFRLNGDLSGARLVFLNDDLSPAGIDDPAPNLFAVLPDGTRVPLSGDVFHTATPNPDDPLSNALNDGGGGQVLSGLESDAAGLTISFEDVRLGHDDDDFNDVTYQVLLEPSTGSSVGLIDLSVAVDAAIVDDDLNLSGAVADITSGEQVGDALLVSLPPGSAISVLEDGSSGLLVLSGLAPVADYVDALRSIKLDPAGEGLREITFSVTDARGAASEDAVVRVDLSTLGADAGDAENNVLSGEPLVNDAIAGRGGNDVLIGFSGDDVLDGGLGDDLLFGDSIVPAANDGDDILIGGPGADILIGSGGADRHLFFTLAERGDEIRGFDATEGDTLDFSELFQGAADPAAVDPFVRFDAVGSDVVVSVDKDGAGSSFAFIAMATMADPTGVTTAQAAADNGSLVVA